MAKGKKLPNIDTPADLDEFDLQIVAFLKNNPKIPYRTLAERIGLSVGATFARVQRIRGSDWVEEMRSALRGLGEFMLESQSAGLTVGEAKDRASVGLRLLSGLGVLEDRRSVKLDLEKATPEQLLNALLEMPDDQFNRLIESRKSR